MNKKKSSKSCGHCKRVKALTDFHKQAKAHDGVHSICKVCRIAYNNAHMTIWRKANQKYYNDYQRKYRARKRAAKKQVSGFVE